MTIDGSEVFPEDRIELRIILYRSRENTGEYLVERAQYDGPEDDCSGDDRKAVCEMLDPVFDGFRKWRKADQ